MEVLVLRFDAPLMSFGGAAIDDQRVTREFPAVSMIAGLVANALGWDHADAAATQRLQDRLRVAARQDLAGVRMVDYQTVDLGQDFLDGTGWTTWGEVETRGGASGTGTHIRHRHYLANAIYTVALRLEPANEAPELAAVEAALERPERPLFLGRKACLPAERLVLGRVEATGLVQALRGVPMAKVAARAHGASEAMLAQWPAEEPEPETGREVYLTDERDWENQIHVGRRIVREGLLRAGGPGGEP